MSSESNGFDGQVLLLCIEKDLTSVRGKDDAESKETKNFSPKSEKPPQNCLVLQEWNPNGALRYFQYVIVGSSQNPRIRGLDNAKNMWWLVKVRISYSSRESRGFFFFLLSAWFCMIEICWLIIWSLEYGVCMELPNLGVLVVDMCWRALPRTLLVWMVLVPRYSVTYFGFQLSAKI